MYKEEKEHLASEQEKKYKSDEDAIWTRAPGGSGFRIHLINHSETSPIWLVENCEISYYIYKYKMYKRLYILLIITPMDFILYTSYFMHNTCLLAGSTLYISAFLVTIYF